MKARINIFEGKDGLWRFNVQAANGELVTQSEGYDSKRNARRAVVRLQSIIGNLSIHDGSAEDEVDTKELDVVEAVPEDDDGQA